MLEKLELEKYKKITQDKYFQEGLKMFQEGRVKREIVQPIWVKKLVGVREYNSIYRDNPSYYLLTKEKEGIWVGFCVANSVPASCEPLTDEEAMWVDDYRRSHNIYPLPLGVVEK